MSDDDPQRAATDRRAELTDHVEHILETVDADLGETAYPVESEELVAQYRSSETEIPNETETFGSAFDRLADEYDNFATPDEAREALTTELDRADAYDETFNDEAGTAAGRTVPEQEAGAERAVVDDQDVGEGLVDESSPEGGGDADADRDTDEERVEEPEG